MSSQLPSGTHTVELVIPDINGILRGKKVPAQLWDHVAHHGVAIANVIFVWGPRCDILDGVSYSNMETGYPDIEIVPDLTTLRAVPWRPGTATVLCDAKEADGSTCTMSPRDLLKGVIGEAAEMGYDVNAAFELEFYLLDPITRLPRETDIQCYGVLRSNAYEDVIGAIRNHLLDFGIPVEASNTEYAGGQFEINVRYDDALTTADSCVLFRTAVKDIAAQHGYLASFMAKPFTDESGCGMHIHQSLWKGGRNAFAGGGTLSDVGRHYLGGLQAHMRDLALLGSPTPNALRRRKPYTFCPVTDAWAVDNRTVGLRVVLGNDNAVRIEQRDGSADANPYLMLAAQIASGLDGVRRKLEPAAPSTGDEYADRLGNPLPTTIPEACALLEASSFAKETMDPRMVEALCAIARFEHDTIFGVVSDAERARYADVF
jgi:glutamine synthetase